MPVAEACTVNVPPPAGTGTDADQVVDAAPGDPRVAGSVTNPLVQEPVAASHQLPADPPDWMARSTAPIAVPEAVPLIVTLPAGFAMVLPVAGELTVVVPHG